MKRLILYFSFVLFLVPIIARADSYVVAGCDLFPTEEGAEYFCGYKYLRVDSTSSITQFTAAIHLPDGAKLTSVVLYYSDNDPSGEVAFYLKKVNKYTDADVTLQSGGSLNSGGALASRKFSPIRNGNTINNGGYSYNVRVYFTGSTLGDSLKFHGFKINYK
jgi:hypothetical protein